MRFIAERLRADKLRVWFDEWLIESDSSQASREKKIEEALENSRTLVLFTSANAFRSNWTQLEARTLRFRDPVNNDRRFILLRLDSSALDGPFAQLGYVEWKAKGGKKEYAKLLEACRPPITEEGVASEQAAERVIKLDQKSTVYAYGYSHDSKRLLSGALDGRVRLWNTNRRECVKTFSGHTSEIKAVAWSLDDRLALSGSYDRTLRVWDIQSGQCLTTMEGHTDTVRSVAWGNDGLHVLSGSEDRTLRLWNITKGNCLQVLEGHTQGIWSVAWNQSQSRALSGSSDTTLRLWDTAKGRCLRVLEGHAGRVRSIAWSSDRKHAISGSYDGTLRLWDIDTGLCLRVFEGHTNEVRSVAWSTDLRYALSGALNGNVRVWDLKTGNCVRVLRGHKGSVQGVMWNHLDYSAFSCDSTGEVREWNLKKLGKHGKSIDTSYPDNVAIEQIQYTNAKVLLVGESGTGKTGLSKRLALDDWQPSDSTLGAWATHWRLPVSPAEGVQREIWLWDFGGQADQRLIHQLYMDETALAVLVFDGQKEDVFETLRQWDRELTRASSSQFAKLLVAGRIDVGGVRVSRVQIEAFKKERGYLKFLETSAKKNIRCAELKHAILSGIKWEEIPWRSSPLLFKQLKEEIVRLKDAGRVLMRFNELREILQLRLMEKSNGNFKRFSDEELRAVVSLLAAPGVVWELRFGSWILLQPERINTYAQAVIQTMREDEFERGCLPEEKVLNGELSYSSIDRLDSEEERFVLLAMHQTLVERGLCLREKTDDGTLLIFPSYYRREREEVTGTPAVLVSYRFSGFLDDIYATLVVRLHHTKPFQQSGLWRHAADFRTLTGKQLGVKLTRHSEGGELEVYFDPTIPLEEKIIFSKYVHEHLLLNARDVERLRHYVCPHCGTSAGNREVAMKKLNEGKRDIPCVNCDSPSKRIPLWDQMEELFASSKMKEQVRALEEQSTIVLDNESKERALVGEVISTVALAGQISREFNVSDHGIDMEIEFKSDDGEATGRKLYLQLKSGDSYLRERKKDGAELFTIANERHSRYWTKQGFPVLLVIRNSEGEVRWMEIKSYLKREADRSSKAVKQIIFTGERFDVMSVRTWRQRLLGLSRA